MLSRDQTPLKYLAPFSISGTSAKGWPTSLIAKMSRSNVVLVVLFLVFITGVRSQRFFSREFCYYGHVSFDITSFPLILPHVKHLRFPLILPHNSELNIHWQYILFIKIINHRFKNKQQVTFFVLTNQKDKKKQCLDAPEYTLFSQNFSPFALRYRNLFLLQIIV